MPAEPSWSKKIANSSVCTWFYALAVLNLLFGTAGVLSALYMMSKGKENMFGILLVALAASIGFTNSWFLFLVCNRGLHV